MVEVDNFDDVGLTYDLVRKHKVPVTITPGKHANDHMYSFYLAGPSGWMFDTLRWAAGHPPIRILHRRHLWTSPGDWRLRRRRQIQVSGPDSSGCLECARPLAAWEEIDAGYRDAKQEAGRRRDRHAGAWARRGAGQDARMRNLRIGSARTQACGAPGRRRETIRRSLRDGLAARYRDGPRVLCRSRRLRAVVEAPVKGRHTVAGCRY